MAPLTIIIFPLPEVWSGKEFNRVWLFRASLFDGVVAFRPQRSESIGWGGSWLREIVDAFVLEVLEEVNGSGFGGVGITDVVDGEVVAARESGVGHCAFLLPTAFLRS